MIAVTGANGQLGSAIVLEARALGIDCLSLDRRQLDITDVLAVKRYFEVHPVDCIINCAAYTAVDRAEDEIEAAYAANAKGPLNLAASNVPVVHFSTDYVFDGTATQPYETDAQRNPLSVYGKSKAAGETALLEAGVPGKIIRTSRVYSTRPQMRNFYHTICRLAAEKDELGVVSDQFSAPTLTDDLAKAVLKLFLQGAVGQSMEVLHFANAGTCSWYEFACAIVEENGLSCKIKPIKTSDYKMKAQRPACSELSLVSVRRYGIEPRCWRDALHAACLDRTHVLQTSGVNRG